MFTNDELHKRIRLLEEEICYLHKDMANLINIVEALKPEQHTHYTNIFYTKCMDDNQDLENFNQ